MHHVIINLCLVVIPNGRRSIKERRQEIFLDVAHPGRVLLHAVQHIFHMVIPELQESGPYQLCRIAVPGDIDPVFLVPDAFSR